MYERENTNVNICYSLDAMNWLMENNRDISFAKLIDAYAKDNENTTTKNIYDKENQIIVTIKKVDNLYVIDDIIPFAVEYTSVPSLLHARSIPL